MKKSLVYPLLLGSLLLAGCSTSQPIQNINHEQIALTLNQEQVERAIMQGGKQKGWTMQRAEPGLIHGTITVRSHQATIKVPYTNRDFSILYVSSKGLDDEGQGTIHRNYNKWISLLDQAIRLELNSAANGQ